MKKMIFLSILFLMFAGIANAADDSGFEIDDVRIDGSLWSSNIPTINVGQSYNVDMQVTYTRSEDRYLNDWTPSISANIKLPDWFGAGPIVWQDSSTSGLINNSASWTLSSSLMVSNSPLLDINPRLAGLYLYADGKSGIIDIDYRLANIEGAAPVPEPSTVLIVGVLLAGLIGYSRFKKQA